MVNLRHALTHARHGDWAHAHGMVQDDQSLLGAWLHGMAHIAEHDLANAAYWYARRPELRGEGGTGGRAGPLRGGTTGLSG